MVTMTYEGALDLDEFSGPPQYIRLQASVAPLGSLDNQFPYSQETKIFLQPNPYAYP